ncbi:MAG: hypothetical protein KDA84_10470, partial [Planctomycetaceae bacterium]|nr:hypothetical protein [Planctomycetaceae bacterium]
MAEPMKPDDFEARVLSFEQAWQGDSPPTIANFLPASLVPDDRRRLLQELVCIDLEYRWQHAETDKQITRFSVVDYLREFPELGDSPERFRDLASEEYRVRHCWGDQPNHAEFLAQFDEHQNEIAQTLRQVDRELETERETESSPRTISPDSGATPSGETFDPRAPL